MEDFNFSIFIISSITLIFGAVYAKIAQWPISEPILAMFGGIVCGPYLLNVLDLSAWGDKNSIMLVASRLTIAMALMATALRLPTRYFQEHFKSQSIIVVFGMLLMWLFSTIIFSLIFDIPIIIAALAGAIITPTDPVVAASIISGDFAEKHFSKKIRRTLSFESGANDGLAFPIVAFPLLFLTIVEPFEHWLLMSFLWETVGGILLGFIAGTLAGKMIRVAHKKKLMTEKSLLASSLALAFVIIGGFEIIKVNSIIAVFVGGLAFNGHISKKEDLKDEKIQEVMERLFVVPIFFFFGLIIPFDQWLNEGWLLILLVVSIMIFRRIPTFFVMKKAIKGYSKLDILTLGWLGPIGVTSIFYVFHVQEKFHDEFLWTATSALVFGSTIVHGTTASIIAKWYKRKNPVQDN